jgi:hypothetical protein
VSLGGGHQDYYGNDVNCINLTQSTPAMTRVKDSNFPVNYPTLMDTTTTNIIALGNNANGSFQVAGQNWKTNDATNSTGDCISNSDGSGCAPNSRHTTQGMQFVPGRCWGGSSWALCTASDFVFVANGSVTANAGSVPDTWILPFASAISNSTTWTRADKKSNFSATSSLPQHFGNTTAVDPRNGLVYMTDPVDVGPTVQALYAFDWFGSIDTNSNTAAPNRWDRLTPTGNSTTAFHNTTDMSAALWNDTSTSKYWFIALGGCKSEAPTSISNNGSGTFSIGITQVLTNTRSNWLQNMTVYLYNTGSVNLDGGPYTITSATSDTATQTLTATGGPAASASVTNAGLMVTCDRGVNTIQSLLQGYNGIQAADVTNTASFATHSVSRVDWTAGTLAIANVDLGAVGYNTCAEFLSGGTAPLKGSSTNYGGISPGLVLDGATGKLIGWPNEGGYVYEITPDPTYNSNQGRLKCKRLDYTGSADVPPNSAVNGASSTWGTYGNGKFFYDPAADAFVLCHMPDQACRALRIR